MIYVIIIQSTFRKGGAKSLPKTVAKIITKKLNLKNKIFGSTFFKCGSEIIFLLKQFKPILLYMNNTHI